MAGRLKTMAALAGGIALGGCFYVESDVPAVPDAALVTESPVTVGYYCNADVDIGDDGLITDVDVADCFDVRFADGVLTLDPREEGEESYDVKIADLERGASLMQAYDVDEESYALFLAMMGDDAFILLPPPPLSRATYDDAAAKGVTVEIDEDLDPHAEGAFDTDSELHITGGAPEDVLAVMRNAAGRWFDTALRDDDVREDFDDDSIYYVRVDAPIEKVEPDSAELIARLEPVRERIARAMTLE